jgi:hypothetical protein
MLWLETRSKCALPAVHFCCHSSCMGDPISGALSWTPTGPVGSFTSISVSVWRISTCTSTSESTAVAALLVLKWKALSRSGLRRSLKALALSAPVSGIFRWFVLVRFIYRCPLTKFLLVLSSHLARYFEIFAQTSQCDTHHCLNLRTSKSLWHCLYRGTFGLSRLHDASSRYGGLKSTERTESYPP